jgi:hypothetical protein
MAEPAPSAAVIIGNLPPGADEVQLRQIFGPYGTVTSCMPLPGNKARVTFQSLDEAKWMRENLDNNIPEGLSQPVSIRYAGGVPPPGKGGGMMPMGQGGNAGAWAMPPMPAMPQQPQQQKGGWMPPQSAWQPNLNADQENLVIQVKELQKNDHEAKQQWCIYTDLNGQGKRDPSKHGADFLKSFLSGYASGKRFQTEEENLNVPALTKYLQKKSEPFKVVWAQYCNFVGGGVHDPVKHEPMFHIQFFDHLARSSMSNMAGVPGIPPPEGMAVGGAPMKRMRDSDNSGPKPVVSSGDPVKDQLVQRIKNYQKLGQQEKELWWNHCETHLGGVRDPGRHDVATLQDFVNNYQVPEMPLNPLPTTGPYVIGSDPFKDSLINRVKTFQKMGEEQKNLWYGFCGPMRDPSRHESANLQQFCDMYGVLEPMGDQAWNDWGPGQNWNP